MIHKTFYLVLGILLSIAILAACIAPSANLIPPTPTPDASQQAENIQTVYPTPTEIPISKYTDISPSLNDQDKFIILVNHSDGTYEQFTVGPLRSYIVLLNELPDYIIDALPLQLGDEIIAWLPPANPYRAIGTESSTATQSIIHPTEILPTPMPFPYP